MRRIKLGRQLEEQICNIRYEEFFDKEQFSDIDVAVYNIRGYCIDRKTLDLLKERQYIEAIKTIYKVIYNVLSNFVLNIIIRRYPKFDFGEIFDICSVEDKDAWDDWNNKKWKEIGQVYQEREIYIHAYNGIIHDKEIKNDFDISKIIQSKKSIGIKINTLFNNIDKCVGIHIRRTDHDRTKRLSPTSLLIYKMNELIEIEKELNFFDHRRCKRRKIY